MSVEKALDNLRIKLSEKELRAPITFEEFLYFAANKPKSIFRNIFQQFADMIRFYIGEGRDENPEDPEFINFMQYDCSRLFVQGSESPFFSDRLFANRLVALSKSFRAGAQRNKIFIFEGPTGSGKSTFLNNLLHKFEEYTNSEEGLTYEIVWKIDKNKLASYLDWEHVVNDYKAVKEMAQDEEDANMLHEIIQHATSPGPLEVPCPSHDSPILIVPKQYRKRFINQIIDDKEFKEQLFTRKEYEWIFKNDPCTICSSLYHTLLDKLEKPDDVFKMVYVRKFQFDRRLGEGITVYNPGDMLRKKSITNPVLQKILNDILKDSNAVQYVFSNLARTNNGIFAIMDVKSHNKDRLMNLHGIISDNVHKVEHIEERINSLFIALMNPEDKDVIESVKSLGDRITRIPMPYVLDYRTEVEIYHNKFGKEIDELFLPGVLNNFAKVVISSRLNPKSETLEEWIPEPGKYSKYCDKDLMLLKMELYSGNIPDWLTEEDIKNFVARRRKSIVAESEKDGQDETSISGRQSIEIFNEFYSKYAKKGSLIDMAMVYKYFKEKKEKFKKIPEGFLDSLVTLYDYNVLQQIKEALYNYNLKEIVKDILNYMFAVNFEPGAKVTSVYTGMDIEVTEEFLKRIEAHLMKEKDRKVEKSVKEFRMYVQKEYTSKTLSYEIGVEKKDIKETTLLKVLLEKYQHNLKEDVLNPFLKNDNFRNAIKDFGAPDFKSYDKTIIRDVRFLIKNLKKKYSYTDEGAKQVCMYVMDKKIPEKFIDK